MPFIRTVTESEAQGAVKTIYESSLTSYGRIANIVKLLSPDPHVMQASMELFDKLMQRSNALDPARREMIATVVSHANDCYYCTLSHAANFHAESEDPNATEVSEQLIYDYRQAILPDADRALCDYAVKLTLKPGAVSKYDIKFLHEHGFDDAAINIAAQVVSFCNYINRIADGLGVAPEPDMTPSEEIWRSLKTTDHVI